MQAEQAPSCVQTSISPVDDMMLHDALSVRPLQEEQVPGCAQTSSSPVDDMLHNALRQCLRTWDWCCLQLGIWHLASTSIA